MQTLNIRQHSTKDSYHGQQDSELRHVKSNYYCMVDLGNVDLLFERIDSAAGTKVTESVAFSIEMNEHKLYLELGAICLLIV